MNLLNQYQNKQKWKNKKNVITSLLWAKNLNKCKQKIIIKLAKKIKRDDNDLTRLVYEAQKKEPLRGDFVKVIEENAQLINYVKDEEKIRNISKYEHPKEIKQKIRTAAFKHLQTLQVSHSKVKNIKLYTLKL